MLSLIGTADEVALGHSSYGVLAIEPVLLTFLIYISVQCKNRRFCIILANYLHPSSRFIARQFHRTFNFLIHRYFTGRN